MEFTNCSVYNFENALRGMRNPKNSWDRSDSYFGIVDLDNSGEYKIVDKWCDYEGIDFESDDYARLADTFGEWLLNNGILIADYNRGFANVAFIGPKDMNLAQNLVKAGPEHRKFLRQIFVSVDITAPLYFWKELDTYKIGTTANSQSTMHKLAETPITLDKFEIDDFVNIEYPIEEQRNDKSILDTDFIQMGLIPYLEYLRKTYLKLLRENPEEAKVVWKELVRWLPEGWLQTRTWTGNYETLRNIYHQRKNHKLIEWRKFCGFIETLPYAKNFITI